MSYTVEQLIWAIRLGRASASKETGAALILSAAEQMQLAPLETSARGISLSPAGAVVLSDAAPGDNLSCDRQLRSLLALFLGCCGGEHLQLERVASSPPCGVAHLASELSAALIPFNRSAARRALTRLYRRIEAAGAVPAGELPLDVESVEWARNLRSSVAPAPRSSTVAQANLAEQPCRATASECFTPPAPTVSEQTPFWGSAAPPEAPMESPETSEPTSSAPAAKPAPLADDGEAPGIATVAADGGRRRAAQLLFGRFEARRSNLGKLVSEFAMETFPEARQTAQALCRSFDEQAEWGRSSCTPLPPSAADAVTSG